MRFPAFMVELPLLDENGQIKGSLYRFIKNKPKYLPRVGDSVYVLGGISPKVQEVNFSGPSYGVVRLVLEPIAISYRSVLETNRFRKGNEKWQWKDKTDL